MASKHLLSGVGGNFVEAVYRAREALGIKEGEFCEVEVDHQQGCRIFFASPCDCNPKITIIRVLPLNRN